MVQDLAESNGQPDAPDKNDVDQRVRRPGAAS